MVTNYYEGQGILVLDHEEGMPNTITDSANIEIIIV